MTIAARDRKILWGRAGNRCAKCRTLLVPATESSGSQALVGEECHIVSPRPSGPRGGEARPGGVSPDAYENLILLCPTDHSLVDQLPTDYPVAKLVALKADHEAWVEQSLDAYAVSPVAIARGYPDFLREVRDGGDLLSIVASAEESSFDHESTRNRTEAETVGEFAQVIHDYAEIWEDLEPGARISAAFELGELLDTAKAAGWRVFAARGRGSISGGVSPRPSSWDTAYVRLVRADSPAIVAIGNSGLGDQHGLERPYVRVEVEVIDEYANLTSLNVHVTNAGASPALGVTVNHHRFSSGEHRWWSSPVFDLPAGGSREFGDVHAEAGAHGQRYRKISDGLAPDVTAAVFHDVHGKTYRVSDVPGSSETTVGPDGKERPDWA
jgi:hypothetical protein